MAKVHISFQNLLFHSSLPSHLLGQAKEVEETDMEASQVGRLNTPHEQRPLVPSDSLIQSNTRTTCSISPPGVALEPQSKGTKGL